MKKKNKVTVSDEHAKIYFTDEDFPERNVYSSSTPVIENIPVDSDNKSEKSDKQPGKLKKYIISVLCGVLAIVFLASGFKLYTILRDYKTARDAYDSLSDSYVKTDVSPSPASVTPSAAPTSEVLTTPEPVEVSPVQVDFNSLLGVCSDVKGWLYSPDTVINYPIVQSDDNLKYLHNYIDGTYNGSGTLFIDYRCPGDFKGLMTMIYGHHMNDGSMLASICDYRRQEYYDAHPFMYINTPDGNYKLEIFSAFITDASSSVYTFSFSDEHEFEDYLMKMKGFSDFTCDVIPTSSDSIVVFSTCTYEYDEARYVVFGVQRPIN